MKRESLCHLTICRRRTAVVLFRSVPSGGFDVPFRSKLMVLVAVAQQVVVSTFCLSTHYENDPKMSEVCLH
jgi:hypothetical protein